MACAPYPPRIPHSTHVTRNNIWKAAASSQTYTHTHIHTYCMPPHTTNKGRGVCCAVGWSMIGHSVAHGVGWRCWGVTGEGEGINPQHVNNTQSVERVWTHTRGYMGCAGMCSCVQLYAGVGSCVQCAVVCRGVQACAGRVMLVHWHVQCSSALCV